MKCKDVQETGGKKSVPMLLCNGCKVLGSGYWVLGIMKVVMQNNLN